MDKVFTTSTWSKMLQYLPQKSPKLAAVAYVSKGCPISFGRDDLLICDASEPTIKNGNTDPRTLMRLWKDGAKIYSCDSLHCKMLICDKYAIIGSSNLSKSSEDALLEASLITDNSRIRAQIVGLIHNLKSVSKELDEKSIAKLINLPVSPRPRPPKPRRPQVEEPGQSHWAARVSPIDVAKEEEPFVESGKQEARRFAESEESDIDWIKFTGKSEFRRTGKPGDIVLVFFRDGRKTSVIEPRPILIRQDQDNWTRFYIEEKENQYEMSWREFKREVRKDRMKSIEKQTTRKLSTRGYAIIENIFDAHKLRE